MPETPSVPPRGDVVDAVVRTLRRHELSIAERVTDQFLDRHPDWLNRFGDRARTAGVEDARYHVQFLSAAIEARSREAFRDYVQWTTRVLKARGIAAAHLWENLRQVEAAVGQHLGLPERHLVASYLEAASQLPTAAAAEDGSTALALTARMFVQAILAGERKAALNVALEALTDGVSVQDLYVDVLQGSLYEVGARWERNAITVAQEHMATAITQFVMAHLFERVVPPEATRGTVVVTGVPGELHHVGATMVADMLEAKGWQVRFLGSNLPTASILAELADAQPRVLGVSVTMLFNLQFATDLIARAREVVPGLRVVVGGAAFRLAGDWRDSGADHYAPDLRSAISLLCGED